MQWLNTVVTYRIQGAPWSLSTVETVVGVEAETIMAIQELQSWWGLNVQSFTVGVVQEEKRFS